MMVFGWESALESQHARPECAKDGILIRWVRDDDLATTWQPDDKYADEILHKNPNKFDSPA